MLTRKNVSPESAFYSLENPPKKVLKKDGKYFLFNILCILLSIYLIFSVKNDYIKRFIVYGYDYGLF
mgnify:CR=1 FL=1|jgi:hypothetical protein